MSRMMDLATPRAIGVLIFASIALGMASSVPALERPGYLVTLPTIETHVLLAVVLQFVMGTAYVCIVGLTFPIVRRHSEGLAFVYLGLRLIGAAFLFTGALVLLLLLLGAQQFLGSDLEEASNVQAIGELLRVGRDSVNHIGMILPWSLGGLILSYGLLRVPLVPRWLAMWGLSGYALTLISTVLLIVGVIEIVSPVYVLLNAPTALMEVVLASVLLTRGFNRIDLSSLQAT